MIHRTHTIREEGVYNSQLDDDGKMPVSLFLPQAYEPRYPYPLLVFLHGHGENEKQWIDAVPSLSRRNYICIGLRGLQTVTRRDGQIGYGWGRNRRADGDVEDYILTAIRETMRACHVHSERIFLAGICEGATIAYQMGINFADKFAGIVALNGSAPTGPLPLRRLIESELRVFIGHGTDNRKVLPAKAQKAYQLLYSTGLDVDLRFYPVDHGLHPAMLRDVDRWLMKQCRCPID